MFFLYVTQCARILRKMCLGCRQGRNALSLPKLLPAPWPPVDAAYTPAPATHQMLPDLQLNDKQIAAVNATNNQSSSPQPATSSRFVHSFLPSIAVGSLAGAYGAISSSLINYITPSRLSGSPSPTVQTRHTA